MAGFSIVMIMFIMIIIISIIYTIFQICAILGIAFSIVTLVRSDKFIKTAGRTNFRSTKSFNTAATVFFVISCIVGGLTLLMYGALAAEMALDPEETTLDIFLILLAAIIGCGCHIACVVLKLISAKKFRIAEEYQSSLIAAGISPVGAVPQSAAYAAAYTTDTSNSQAEKIYCPCCGTENNGINRFCVQCGEAITR